MKLRSSLFFGFLIFFVPDFIFILIFVIFFTYYSFSLKYFAFIFLIFVFLKILFFYISKKFFYEKRINLIKSIITNFRKGKFVIKTENFTYRDSFVKILSELVALGKHLNSIVSSQRDEIDKFYEFYHNIVFSINSYFIVLDDEDKIIYANEGFCQKFAIDQDEIAKKKLNDIFYFANSRMTGAITESREKEETVILEKTHLLFKNKTSIVANVKISSIFYHSKKQVIIILDDVTTELQKDYQLNLMQKITESVSSDDKIEVLLYSILTGITSGSGLGFNRAMLFLLENEKTLEGKMAVGPDTFEEAIEIWSSMGDGSCKNNDFNHIKKSEFLKQVLLTKYSLKKDDNILTKAVKEKLFYHITDAFNDDQINEELRKFLGVNEFVIVPIMAVNRSIGLIIADNKFNNVPINHENIQLLKIFVAQAALSIEGFNRLNELQTEMDKIREKQDAIVESEKMAAVGRIAAHISHEIRNPLVTMGGYARRIESLSQKSKNEAIAKSAKIILTESERLEKILSNVMDFTRPSQYLKEFNNLNTVIEDTVELLQNIFSEKLIKVKLDLDDELPLIKSDSNQMKQVMLNLLQNAIDATPSKGKISITTETKDNKVYIYVKDTGTGINEKDPNIVFEPFFTSKVTGVGLGLANVKKLIKDHNGKIYVKNRESVQGVKFTIEFPIE